jgi:hypothetical protein
MVRELNAFLKHNDVIFELLDEAKIDVYSINNFNSSLVTAKGTAQVQKRIQLANQIKNFQNAVIMDTKDKYEQKTLTFGGLAEILKELRIGLAAALRIPISKLFGTGASGLNSAQDDLENYNCMVESEIRQRVRRAMRVVISLRMLQMWQYTPKFNFEFKPLRLSTETEDEAIKTSRQERILALYDKALISSKEVGQILHKYDILPIETDLQKGLLEDHPVSPDSQAQALPDAFDSPKSVESELPSDSTDLPTEHIKTPVETADSDIKMLGDQNVQ